MYFNKQLLKYKINKFLTSQQSFPIIKNIENAVLV